jgi:hypothetical protein
MAAEPVPDLFPPIITDQPVLRAAGRQTGRKLTPPPAPPPPRRGTENLVVVAAPPPPGKPQSPGPQPPPPGRQPPPLRSRGGVAIVVTDGEGNQSLPWMDRVKHWFIGFGGESLGVSLAVHGVLLLILGLMIATRPTADEELVTTVSSNTADIVEFEPLDVDFDMLPEEEIQVKNPLLEPAPAAPSDLLADTTLDRIIGRGEGLLGDKGGGEMFNLPRKFFSKGSFTVWTDPQDPAPSEDYHIVVQVDVSDARNKGGRYPKRDISGSVVGTDNYRQKFGGPEADGYFDVVKNRVQFRILVPGAAQLVRDTIEVRSEMLKEHQTIEIVF